MKTLIIAEKETAAVSIGNVLNVTEKKGGYYQSDEYFITWTQGHLFGLAEPKHYDNKYSNWSLDDLPILPTTFEVVLKDNKFAKSRIKLIQFLLKQSSSIINATDAAREGELIFRYLYNHLGTNKPVKRAWLKGLTEDGITQAFNNLLDNKQKESLYLSAFYRAISDWVIGLNITRAFTLANKSSVPLSLGRVQSPVLFMIADRFIKNSNFISTDYFVPQLQYKTINANLICDEKLNQEEANKIISICTNKEAEIVEKNDEIKTSKAPLLFDLAKLQQMAFRTYKYDTEASLKILQNLYEKHKIISYPRTDSRHLSDDLYIDVQETIKTFNSLDISIISKCSDFIIDNNLVNVSDKNTFNNSKVSDHYAIIPIINKDLDKIYKNLTIDEKNIYHLILESFIKRFLPKYHYRNVKYKFQIGEYFFAVSGNTPVQGKQGWKINLFNKSDSEDPSNPNDLPDLNLNFKFSDYVISSNKKKTTAPPLLNTDSLIGYAKNVHTFFKSDKEELKNIKEKGLGTPATLSVIIKTLITRNYIEIKKHAYIPTNLGLLIYHKIKNEPIASPMVTAEMEEYLEKIRLKEIDTDNVIHNISNFTKDIIKSLINNADPEKFNEILNANISLKNECPKCKKGKILIKTKNYHCSLYPECDYSIFKTFFNKKLSKKIVEEVLTKGITSKEITGLKSSKGKTFKAFIKLNKENLKFELFFKDKK